MSLKLRGPWFGALAVVIVAAATWSVRQDANARPGPLEPLGWLVGGVWRPEVSGTSPERSFAWSSEGLTLRETRREQGQPAGEVTYHWHHAKDEIALYGVLPSSHFEGVLRARPDGELELQWKLYRSPNDVALFREFLLPDGPDRLRWRLLRITESGDTLEREATLTRERR
jgi:hypothetical protein